MPHKGYMETSNTNINIHILMLYADIDAVTDGNLLIGHLRLVAILNGSIYSAVN